jgi:hypothetical protein
MPKAPSLMNLNNASSVLTSSKESAFSTNATLQTSCRIMCISIKPLKELALRSVMQGIKGVSAHKINMHRGSKGKIWLHESYDRIIRNENEYFEKLH